MRMDHPLFLQMQLGPLIKSLIEHEKATMEDPLYLFLDEVNYAPQWDLWLKTFFDERWPLRIVATSSSVAALRNRSVESGIGRWSEQFLTPYNFLEYRKLVRGKEALSQGSLSLSDCIENAMDAYAGKESFASEVMLYMLVGGFPEIILNDLNPDDIEGSMLRSQQTLRTEAVQRVTGMDLPQVFHVQQPIEMERLLYLLAGNMCGLMNISKMCSSLAISQSTVKQYVDYLEKAFLIFTLPTYSRSEDSVQRRGRKVYFVDGAVRNAALQRGIAPASDPGERGWLVENVVASHLHALSLQSGHRLFHWREGTNEVDFVYEDHQDKLAFEVSGGASHHLKGINAFKSKYPEFSDKCYLISAQSDGMESPTANRQGVGRIPLHIFLIAVGMCIGSSLTNRLGMTK